MSRYSIKNLLFPPYFKAKEVTMRPAKNMLFYLAGLCLAGSAIAGGTTSGSLDTSFGKRGAVVSSFSGAALSINLQADGKSVATGLGNNLARYNTDGSLDISFGSGGVVNTGYQTSSIIQTDGKIIVFGQDPVNNSTAVIKRYNSNGTLDNTFGVNGVVVPNFGADARYGLSVVKQQADGKILVGGQIVTNTFTYYDGWTMTTRTDVGGLMARFNANGSADTSFGNNGVVINFANSAATDNRIHGLTVQENGQIVTTGSNPTLARYNVNGTLDTTFGTNGKVFDTRFDDPSLSIPPYVAAGDVFIDSNGKITTALVRTWVAYNMNPILVRYNSDGTPDNLFGTVGAVRIGDAYAVNTYYTLSGLAFQNGKIIISGAKITDTYNSRHNTWTTTRASILGRYQSNGAIDTIFGNAGLVTTTINGNDFVVNDVVIQGDGKIVAAGMTDTDSSAAVVNNFALTRYNP